MGSHVPIQIEPEVHASLGHLKLDLNCRSFSRLFKLLIKKYKENVLKDVLDAELYDRIDMYCKLKGKDKTKLLRSLINEDIKNKISQTMDKLEGI